MGLLLAGSFRDHFMVQCCSVLFQWLDDDMKSLLVKVADDTKILGGQIDCAFREI